MVRPATYPWYRIYLAQGLSLLLRQDRTFVFPKGFLNTPSLVFYEICRTDDDEQKEGSLRLYDHLLKT